MVCTIDIHPDQEISYFETVEPTTDQLRELLQISESTRKRYVAIAKTSIGRAVNFRSHQRRYSNQQLRVLGLIRDLISSGWLEDQVVKQLRKINPEAIEIQCNSNNLQSFSQPLQLRFNALSTDSKAATRA